MGRDRCCVLAGDNNVYWTAENSPLSHRFQFTDALSSYLQAARHSYCMIGASKKCQMGKEFVKCIASSKHLGALDWWVNLTCNSSDRAKMECNLWSEQCFFLWWYTFRQQTGTSRKLNVIISFVDHVTCMFIKGVYRHIYVHKEKHWVRGTLHNYLVLANRYCSTTVCSQSSLN